MLPIRDDNPTATRAWMTLFLVASNVAASVVQWLLPPDAQMQVVQAAALVPARLSGSISADGLPPIATLVTSQFLHGGLLHLGGNMLFLWIFGNNVEDELGSLRFLLFYLLCGMVAGLIHFATEPASATPTVGASGAISGVMAAYAILFPRARVHTLVVLVFYVTVVPLPAVLWIAIWLGIQLVQGFASLGRATGVAWFAHIGGFAGGAGLLWLFRRRRPRPRIAPFRATWNR